VQLISETFTNHDQGKRFNSFQYRRDLSIELKYRTIAASVFFICISLPFYRYAFLTWTLKFIFQILFALMRHLSSLLQDLKGAKICGWISSGSISGRECYVV